MGPYRRPGSRTLLRRVGWRSRQCESVDQAERPLVLRSFCRIARGLRDSCGRTRRLGLHNYLSIYEPGSKRNICYTYVKNVSCGLARIAWYSPEPEASIAFRPLYL